MSSFLKKLDAAFERVGGFVGGVVCGLLGCVAAFYFYGIYRFSFWWFLLACCALVPLLGLIGLLFPRPFLSFAAVASIFLGDGHVGTIEGSIRDSLHEFALYLAFFVGLIAFVFGSVFQTTWIYALGAGLLLFYAVRAPVVLFPGVRAA